jgi:hypothetical protein
LTWPRLLSKLDCNCSLRVVPFLIAITCNTEGLKSRYTCAASTELAGPALTITLTLNCSPMATLGGSAISAISTVCCPGIMGVGVGVRVGAGAKEPPVPADDAGTGVNVGAGAGVAVMVTGGVGLGVGIGVGVTIVDLVGGGSEVGSGKGVTSEVNSRAGVTVG